MLAHELLNYPICTSKNLEVKYDSRQSGHLPSEIENHVHAFSETVELWRIGDRPKNSQQRDMCGLTGFSKLFYHRQGTNLLKLKLLHECNLPSILSEWLLVFEKETQKAKTLATGSGRKRLDFLPALKESSRNAALPNLISSPNPDPHVFHFTNFSLHPNPMAWQEPICTLQPLSKAAIQLSKTVTRQPDGNPTSFVE